MSFSWVFKGNDPILSFREFQRVSSFTRSPARHLKLAICVYRSYKTRVSESFRRPEFQGVSGGAGSPNIAGKREKGKEITKIVIPEQETIRKQ